MSSRTLPLVEDPLERFIRSIESIWQSKHPDRSQIAARLNRLRALCIEDEIELDLDSLEHFVRFVGTHSRLAAPEIVVTPLGHIRASWTRDQRSHLAVEFVDPRTVELVLFAPRQGSVARIAGVEEGTRVLGLAEVQGAEWIWRPSVV